MANTLRLKRSAVASKIPLTSDLELGEIAINTHDGVIFIKKDNGTASIVAIGGGVGVTDGDKGDITVSTSGLVWTIDSGAVSYSKIQNVSDTNKILGRFSSGAGIIEEITCTSAGRALIDDADAAAQRVTLGLGTLATQDGTFSGTSSGTNTGDQTITLTGDVTGSGTGSFGATIGNSKVTYAKIQDVSVTDRLLGRSSIGGGVVEEIACTAAGRALIDDANAAAQRDTLGLGTLATQDGTFSGTSSGTNTGDQNIFSTIAVSGQSNVIADSTTDTLTLVAGSNITITTDASTDSITIAAGASGITSLNTLSASTQTFATGTTGTDFNISSSTSTHTFNIPDASTTARGAVTTGTQTFTGLKTFSSPATSSKVLIVQGIASQTANLLEVQDSSLNNLLSVSPAGDVSVLGNLTVNGTTQTVNSTVVTIDDPVMTLGGDTAPTIDDNKDRGIEFRWHNGTSAKVGFFGYDDSTSKFTCIPDATNTSEVFSGAAGNAAFNTIESTVSTGTAPLTVASTTVCTNLNADTVDGYHASAFLLPAGMITAYGGSAAPTGWLLCQGQAVSRTTYSDLFTAIGTAYGVGDGSTTFNVPDLQQRFPLGKAASGTGATLGGTGGAIDHTHTVAAHYHGVGTLATGTTGSGHGHGLGTLATGTTGSGHGHGFSLTAASGGEHTHTYTINYQSNSTNTDNGSQTRLKGTDSAGTTRQNTTAIVFNNTGTHSHSVTGSVGGADGGHTHNVTGTIGGSDGTHTHNLTGSVGATAGSNGDSAITTSTGNPPYLVVNYIIKT